MNVLRKLLSILLLMVGVMHIGNAQTSLKADSLSFYKKLDSTCASKNVKAENYQEQTLFRSNVEFRDYNPDSIPSFHYTAEAYPFKELDKSKFWSNYPVYEIPLVYPSSDYPVYTLPLVDPSKVYPVYEIPLVNYSEVYPVHELFDTIKDSEWPDSIMIFHELKSIELKKKEKPKKGKRFKKLPPNKN